LAAKGKPICGTGYFTIPLVFANLKDIFRNPALEMVPPGGTNVGGEAGVTHGLFADC